MKNELDEALRREAREGRSSIVIPVTVDDYVFSEWEPDQEMLSRTLRDRVIVDFKSANDDESWDLAR